MDLHGSGSRARRLHSSARRSREAARLDERKQIGHNGLTAVVLVGPIGMQTVATAAGAGINQSGRKIVSAEKPLEGDGGGSAPIQITVGTPGSQSGCNRGGRFERLLVEGPGLLTLRAKTLRTHGTEKAGFARLYGSEPPK